MKHLSSFNEHFKSEKEILRDSLSERLKPYYDVLDTLDLFKIKKPNKTQHIVITMQDEEYTDCIDLFEDEDHLDTWVAIERRGENNLVEISNINDMLNYLCNNIRFFNIIRFKEVQGLPSSHVTAYDLWKLLIEKDPSYQVECPIEYLAKMKRKLSPIAKLGVFDRD